MISLQPYVGSISRNDGVHYCEMYLLILKRPKYPLIRLQEIKKTARLENEVMVERGETNKFGDQAHDIFNDLPKTMRVLKDREVFINEAKRYYRDRALARSLSL